MALYTTTFLFYRFFFSERFEYRYAEYDDRRFSFTLQNETPYSLINERTRPTLRRWLRRRLVLSMHKLLGEMFIFKRFLLNNSYN